MGASGDDGSDGEFAVLDRMRRRLEDVSRYPGMRLPLAGEVFSGDDAAVLQPPPGRLLLAIDLVVEGVHFDLALGSLADAGWKAMAVNASDVAAMGGRPLHAVVGVSAPAGTDLDLLSEGMAEAASAYSMALVGGDLSMADGLVIAVAITGSCGSLAPVLRRGAQVGDRIWVTGPLGAAAAGLRVLRSVVAGGGAGGVLAGGGAAALAGVAAYRRPQARVEEGVCAATLGATAMIDVSDGLAQDLDHIATDSAVGVRLTAVPVADGATLGEALGGGEDYELVFTAPPGVDVAGAFGSAGLRSPTAIGECVGDVAERTLEGRSLSITGWSHSFG
jgi:thiamine-monophosphate kinase